MDDSEKSVEQKSLEKLTQNLIDGKVKALKKFSDNPIKLKVVRSSA